MRLVDKLIQLQAKVVKLRAEQHLQEENWSFAERNAREKRDLWNAAMTKHAEALRECQKLLDIFIDAGPDKEIEE